MGARACQDPRVRGDPRLSLLDLMDRELEADELVTVDRPLIGKSYAGKVWRGERFDQGCEDSHAPGEPAVICCWFDGIGHCQGAVARRLIHRR